MRALIATLACTAALLSGLAGAAAQPDHVRDATAKLAASGKSSQDGGQVGSDATGIVVSEDGFILTTYHIIDKLGRVFPASVKITAKLGGRGEALATFVVDARPNIDLLLLKVQLPGPYDHFTLGSAYDVGNAPVHTYGFPAEGQHDVTDTSSITSRTVEGGYLWNTDFNLAEGQSGSPVYNDNGEVVAIAKGEVNKRGAIVPIDYADTLIGFLRSRRDRTENGHAEDGAEVVGAVEKLQCLTEKQFGALSSQIEIIFLNNQLEALKRGDLKENIGAGLTKYNVESKMRDARKEVEELLNQVKGGACS